jgi:hypothetical protein
MIVAATRCIFVSLAIFLTTTAPTRIEGHGGGKSIGRAVLGVNRVSCAPLPLAG